MTSCGMDSRGIVHAVDGNVVITGRSSTSHGNGAPVGIELTNLGPHHVLISAINLTSPLLESDSLALSTGRTIVPPGKSESLFDAELLSNALSRSERQDAWRHTLRVAGGSASVTATVVSPGRLREVWIKAQELARLGLRLTETPAGVRATLSDAELAETVRTFTVKSIEVHQTDQAVAVGD